MSYERIDPVEFGRQLIETGDLDPVYIMLVRSGMSRDQLCCWCLSYWCFYHVGVASYMSEYTGSEYWDIMNMAAENSLETSRWRWPRGTERRHFRGEQAIQAVAELAEKYPQPEEAFFGFRNLSPITYKSASIVASRWRGFGPWISFKVVDMLDRVFGVAVDWSDCDLDFYRDPLKGGTAVYCWMKDKKYNPDWKRIYELSTADERKRNLTHAVDYLREKFQDLKAPPYRDRAPDIPEIETVLCKWKSHLNGHYPIGKDTADYKEALGTGPLNGSWGFTGDVLRKLLPGEEH